MTVRCEELLDDGTVCGKEYTGSKEKVQLNAHKRQHKSYMEKLEKEKNPDKKEESLREKIERIRRDRTPIGVPTMNWSCPDNDGYQYRVFNDEWMSRPDNIQRALSAGYEFVDSEEKRQKPKVVGTNDNGTPIKGYLMRIPKEIFDEDQAAKQKDIDKVDEQIRSGKFQQGTNDSRYIPTTGINITSDNRTPE